MASLNQGGFLVPGIGQDYADLQLGVGRSWHSVTVPQYADQHRPKPDFLREEIEAGARQQVAARREVEARKGDR
jgi:hypothetical protein